MRRRGGVGLSTLSVKSEGRWSEVQPLLLFSFPIQKRYLIMSSYLKGLVDILLYVNPVKELDSYTEIIYQFS